MARVALLLVLALQLLAAATAARTAVLLESLDMQTTHSRFFQLLSGASVVTLPSHQ